MWPESINQGPSIGLGQGEPHLETTGDQFRLGQRPERNPSDDGMQWMGAHKVLQLLGGRHTRRTKNDHKQGGLTTNALEVASKLLQLDLQVWVGDRLVANNLLDCQCSTNDVVANVATRKEQRLVVQIPRPNIFGQLLGTAHLVSHRIQL